MNILELCLSPDLGGLELYVCRSISELSKTDNVYVVLNKNGKLEKQITPEGYNVSYFTKASKFLPFFLALKLASYIDNNNIDIIHIHWGRDLSLAALAKWFSKRKPRLVYTRQMKITRSKDDFYHRFLYQQVDTFITITKTLADSAKNFLGHRNIDKVHHLYYGVKSPKRILSVDEKYEIRKKLGFNKNDFIIAIFGRIEKFKGQHQLIDVLQKLKKHKDIKGLIVGHAMDKAYLKNLKNKANEAGLEKNIQFMDFVEDPQTWMQACNLILLTTKEETFGLVLAEAMHAGVAVMGTDSGGVPEIIEHGMTGYLFDYGDIMSLANYIIELKEDKEKLKKFALAGKKKAEKLFDDKYHFIKLREILYGDNYTSEKK